MGLSVLGWICGGRRLFAALPASLFLTRAWVNAPWLAWHTHQGSAGSHGAGAVKMGVLVYSGSLLGTSPSFSGFCLPWASHSVTTNHHSLDFPFAHPLFPWYPVKCSAEPALIQLQSISLGGLCDAVCPPWSTGETLLLLPGWR